MRYDDCLEILIVFYNWKNIYKNHCDINLEFNGGKKQMYIEFVKKIIVIAFIVFLIEASIIPIIPGRTKNVEKKCLFNEESMIPFILISIL